MTTIPVALAHDYLTQRGGAERVALAMARAFPGAPLYTTLFDPPATFPEFGPFDIRTSALNRVGALRSHHRLALPLLAPAVSSMRIDAQVLLASSSGWAHGARASGRTVVYCHAPARWLYQRGRYLDGSAQGVRRAGGRIRRTVAMAAAGALGPALRRWDRQAASRAARYLANSTVTRDSIRQVYGLDAEILPPPPAMLPGGEEQPVPGVEPGFLLCVARLLAYKNVDVVVRAAASVAGLRLVVVGDGPERASLQRLADEAGRVRLLGRVADPELRWLYRNARALVAASFEDFGLSPLEAAAFGLPSIVLRGGGYLDTVEEGRTGVFFDDTTPRAVAAALREWERHRWDPEALRAHASRFAEPRFATRLRQIVAEEMASA